MASLPRPFDADDAPQWVGPAERGALASLAAGLDRRFVRGGVFLGKAIAAITTLLADLDAANHALDVDAAAGALAHLHHAADRIAALPQTLRAGDAALQDLAALVRRVDSQVADIHRQLHTFGIYGMNIKIAGAGGDFRIFVDDMAARLRTGGEEVEQFSALLRSVAQAIVPVRRANEAVMAALAGLSGDIDARIRACGSLIEAHLGEVAATGQKLGLLVADTRTAAGNVLSAIQVADSTRQRIEHIVAAIDIAGNGDMVPPGALAHVAALVRALIDRACCDHAAQARSLASALATLTASGNDLTRLIGLHGSGKEGHGHGLRQLEDGIAAVGQMTARLSDTARRAAVMAECIADSIAGLEARLESVEQIVRDVKEIAINTRLLCLRQGQVGAAVAVIAVEVAAQAARLKETAEQIAVAIAELHARNRALPFVGDADGHDLGALLVEARTAIARACSSSEAVLGDSEAAARELMALIGQAIVTLSDEDPVVAQLRATAQALPCDRPDLDAADERWLREVLPHIAALYTMAAERQVHAAFALPGMDSAVIRNTPIAAVVQDDDGFF